MGQIDFAEGRVSLSFWGAASGSWVFDGKEGVAFVCAYADRVLDGHYACAIRDLLNIGAGRAFGDLTILERLMWGEAFGFEANKLQTLLCEFFKLPTGTILVYLKDGSSAVGLMDACFDSERDKALLVALAQAEKNGRDISAALKFLLKLGWATWYEGQESK
jgi:hypothetical protein